MKNSSVIVRMKVKKNNVEWEDDDKRIHYSLERFFKRHGEFSEELLNQEGAFVDILRAVSDEKRSIGNKRGEGFLLLQMFRTKFERVADPVFYILGGNNAFNYSRAIDKLEGYIAPIFGAISSRMQGPNKDKYGFIYRVREENFR